MKYEVMNVEIIRVDDKDILTTSVLTYKAEGAGVTKTWSDIFPKG